MDLEGLIQEIQPYLNNAGKLVVKEILAQVTKLLEYISPQARLDLTDNRTQFRRHQIMILRGKYPPVTIQAIITSTGETLQTIQANHLCQLI